MPLAVRRAAAVDRSFYDDALCRTDTGVVREAWIAEPTRLYKLGSQRVRGEVMNRWAVEVCKTCPVQWECALAAITAGEAAGVWGDTLENLRRIRHRPEVISKAQARGTPVAVAISRAVARST